MRDLMPPLFQLLTGIGFLLFLVVNLMVRKTLKDTASRLLSVAMLLVPVGLYCLAAGTSQSALGKAGPMLIAGGVAFFLSSVCVGAGLLLAARRTG